MFLGSGKKANYLTKNKSFIDSKKGGTVKQHTKRSMYSITSPKSGVIIISKNGFLYTQYTTVNIKRRYSYLIYIVY